MGSIYLDEIIITKEKKFSESVYSLESKLLEEESGVSLLSSVVSREILGLEHLLDGLLRVDSSFLVGESILGDG